MAQVAANGIAIEYEESGARDAPALLVINGLTCQLTWPTEGFYEGLAAAGFRVIRFDNRDIGRSTKLSGAGVPNIAAVRRQLAAGERPTLPYTLDDMAEDAVGLLDALGVARAHVVGFSMGGSIAQILAPAHPRRVASLVLMSATSNAPGLPPPPPEVAAVFTARPAKPGDRESVIDAAVAAKRTLGSRTLPTDEAVLRRAAARDIDRGIDAAGLIRQSTASFAGGSRAALVATIAAPTLVIHGDEDPLRAPVHGEDLARRIPGARLAIIAGMGHDLPAPVVPDIVRMIAEHCRAAGV